MLNEQVPLSSDYHDEGFIKVHSMFNTIQGEGPYAGYPALFVRLYGCNLQCPMCDTEYTKEYEQYNPMHLAQEVKSRLQLMHKLSVPKMNPLVVITGGEPLRQNIRPFVDYLLGMDFLVQIETNGVFYLDLPWGHDSLTVVCSPKTGKIHPKTATRVHAYKYVLSSDGVAEDGLPIAALGHPLGKYAHVARPPDNWSGPVYLNPLDAVNDKANNKNLQAVAQSVTTHGRYIMGVQMHKLIGLP